MLEICYVCPDFCSLITLPVGGIPRFYPDRRTLFTSPVGGNSYFCPDRTTLFTSPVGGNSYFCPDRTTLSASPVGGNSYFCPDRTTLSASPVGGDSLLLPRPLASFQPSSRKITFHKTKFNQFPWHQNSLSSTNSEMTYNILSVFQYIFFVMLLVWIGMMNNKRHTIFIALV